VTGEQSISKLYSGDEERYGDKLSHCTVSIKHVKCFAVPKEQRFYDPLKVLEKTKA